LIYRETSSFAQAAGVRLRKSLFARNAEKKQTQVGQYALIAAVDLTLRRCKLTLNRRPYMNRVMVIIVAVVPGALMEAIRETITEKRGFWVDYSHLEALALK
ncbi:MAG: hypothetical protein QM300_12605, partial [Pseudomonadota bacterium]|nr:hypothetical protein [Pseudomonadota bacterium]